MPQRYFVVPARVPEPFDEELNRRLRSHLVLSVERHRVELGAGSYYSVCVDYLERSPAAPAGRSASTSRPKVDYREVLGAEEFVRYSRLRDLRKAWAAADAVPVYAVFTNQRLAEIPTGRSWG